ncbi:DUF6489 family protein [Granulosicoccus antarcticus]|uniref:Uncharacterized protein n=1 Tax=Granulosicoccus antarcticus IMCC3135 TaxID=1192854 RepID=A0A2Z2NQB7_9GAMM|nr:DUF6489 family protein [Granulosicoccus antarcticus]ASJ73523.1 hypothetical protein IMCC3135_17205 [Granulosicoccus antarcticus IMCC3135]
MKISIDIDCTPEEARQFLGLPDIKPMQDAWLAEMKKKMLADMENFTPATLVESWMATGTANNTDWLTKAFESMTQAAAPPTRKK